MAGKTLNKANLEKLGAEKLAELVMELVEGSAALQRRARLELSAAQGPKEIASDIRKRFATLRRSKTYVDWRKQRALAKDLEGNLGMIETHVAPTSPNEAFELLWSFLLLASSIYERTDDSNGRLGGIFAEAVELIAKVSPRMKLDPKFLAERILYAVSESGYGEFDGIIPAMSEAMGQEGLEHLKQITTAWAVDKPSKAELDHYNRYGLSTNPEGAMATNRRLTASVILADVADAQGDVDAYMARYTPEQLTFHTIAPEVARRLLDAGRVDEAFAIVIGAREAENAKRYPTYSYELDQIFAECLARQGKTDELKAHLLASFESSLSEKSLRAYLKLLPDFDDIDAEEKALDYVEAHPHLGAAIHFLVRWPSLTRASRTIVMRADELNGDAYYTLTDAASSLEPEFPLAATLLRRAMIVDTLNGAKSKRYRYAAKHLAECAQGDVVIEDYCGHPRHAEFEAGLREKHARKYGFWGLVD